MLLRICAWNETSSLAISISVAMPFWTHMVRSSRMDAALLGLLLSLDSCFLAMDRHSSRSLVADLAAMDLESVCSTSMPFLMKRAA